jgi:putative ABC transport system permease protein
MILFHRLVHWLRAFFLKRKLEREMAEEMRFHLEERTADHLADGLPPDEARYAAQRRFGNTASIQEHAREARGWGWLERLGKDLSFGASQLVRSPGFSLLAVVTLGLGIGANTSMFTIINGIVLKPLPYANLDRLDQIYRTTPQDSEGDVSAADFLTLRKSQEGYGDFAALTGGSVSLSEPGQPAQLANAAEASANLFSLLGVQPQLGRDFLPGEDQPGRSRVVILSQRTWQNRFGSRTDVIGRTVRIDGDPHQIVGVLPASFNDWRHLGSIDFFRPLAFTPEQAADRKKTNVQVFGLRSPKLSPAETSGFIVSFGARLAREFPDANAESAWRAETLQSTAGGRGSNVTLVMLIALSSFVVLIACSNLANFLLARTMARAREFAVRAALGASRLQLLRPLFVEALLLSLAGGGLAILVALWFRDWAAVRSTGSNGEQVVFAIDWHVLGWAFVASLATALAFGLAPAIFALRLDLNGTLKSGGRGTTGGRGHQRFRQVLIIGQFALAMVLLAGAALFIRGLNDLHNRRSGWESAQLVTGTVVLPTGTYPGTEKIASFQRLALERLGALPGVASASLCEATPFFHWPDVRKIITEDRERPQPGHEPTAMLNAVSPEYFATFNTRVIAGRAFTEQDDSGAKKVCLVSQTTARAFFGETSPIGRRLAQAGAKGLPEWSEIVGVVADIETVDPDPTAVVYRIYQPLAQEPARQFTIAVRAQGVAPTALVDGIRTVITRLDADLPVSRLQPADQFITRTLYQLRVLRDMLTGFGVLGLGLASIGIYGAIARTTAQRSGEFAIRLALGASVRDITQLVLGTGVRQAVIGSAIGLLGAFGVSKGIAAAFPGIHANSPFVVIGTMLVLVAIALLACWLPARRAGKVDAMTVLRAE